MCIIDNMDTKKVYLAGCLFDLRHLAGNAMLGEGIAKASDGRYSMYLPQDYEPESLRTSLVFCCGRIFARGEIEMRILGT